MSQIISNKQKQAEAETKSKADEGDAYEMGNGRVGAIGELDIVARLEADGYEVIQVQNNSGHGIDIIARDADGNVKCIEVKANSSQLSDAQKQGGEWFVNDRLDRATSNRGHYKVPPNSPEMVDAANTAKDWIADAPKVEYEVHKVDVDRTTGDTSNHRVEGWDPKPPKQ